MSCTIQNQKGKTLVGKGRLFTILVSTSVHLLWKLKWTQKLQHIDLNSREHYHILHNLWLAAINAALKRDCLLTYKVHFGSLARNHQIVLETWSGTLMDEDSLLDDWINTQGVLVGIQRIAKRAGIGQMLESHTTVW
jgi:hypothetical protein